MGFPGGSVVKNSACWCRRHRRHGFDPWVGKIPCRSKWQPTAVFLPEKSHGQRRLTGYSPWGSKESDTTEQLSMHAIGKYLVIWNVWKWSVSHSGMSDSLRLHGLLPSRLLCPWDSPGKKNSTIKVIFLKKCVYCLCFDTTVGTFIWLLNLTYLKKCTSS